MLAWRKVGLQLARCKHYGQSLGCSLELALLHGSYVRSMRGGYAGFCQITSTTSFQFFLQYFTFLLKVYFCFLHFTFIDSIILGLMSYCTARCRQ